MPPPDTSDSATQTEGSLEVQHSMLKGVQFVGDSTGLRNMNILVFLYGVT